MAKGSCLCGKLKIEYEGEPVKKVICHCLQCRKITGSAFTINLLVPRTVVKIDGSPKHYTFTQEVGDIFDTTFCGECGTTIAKKSDSIEELKELAIIEGGILDSGLEGIKPDVQFFGKHRLCWLDELKGLKVFDEFETS